MFLCTLHVVAGALNSYIRCVKNKFLLALGVSYFPFLFLVDFCLGVVFSPNLVFSFLFLVSRWICVKVSLLLL